MRYPIFSISQNSELNYSEYDEDPGKGSFVNVHNSQNYITVKVDRYSSIPFYYCVIRGKLYGSTRLKLLVETLPSDFTKRLNRPAAIEFIRLNSMVGEKTLIDGIQRVPYGCKLVFNKKSGTASIERYWILPGDISEITEEKALVLLESAFIDAVRESVRDAEKIGVNLSGGMDTRQIVGALRRLGKKFTGFTYGVQNNLDVIIAKKLCKRFDIPQFYFKWDGVASVRDAADIQFQLVDGMQALYHGHGVEIFGMQAETVDTVLYGHFLDFFIQAHIYKKDFETELGPVTVQKLYETLDGGPCSVIRGDSIEPSIFEREWVGVFRESMYQEIQSLDYMIPEKRYDALYFVHHGLRRQMSQVQAGAQYLDFRVPGLHSEFFDIAWSIPGRIRKKRKLQIKLIKKIDKQVLDEPFVKDNKKIKYKGNNPFRRSKYKADDLLRSKSLRVLEPYYDYYGKGLRDLANRDLFYWMKESVLGSKLKDLGVVKPDFLHFLFSGDEFNTRFSDGIYGSMYSLARFVETYVDE